MSSANRERRRQNRETRMVAVEESLRRTRRQRIMFAVIGLALAVVVGVVLVSRASSGGKKASSTTTTTADTSTTAATTTTVLASAAGRPCVATSTRLPAGTPPVPVRVGPAPKQLVKQDLKVGTGKVVTAGDTLTVNYVGVSCSTGKVFASTFAAHQPYTTPLAAMLPGWIKGLPGMRAGGERLLGLPASLAYGAKSPGAGVAPNESLWFVVQVVKVVKAK